MSLAVNQVFWTADLSQHSQHPEYYGSSSYDTQIANKYGPQCLSFCKGSHCSAVISTAFATGARANCPRRAATYNGKGVQTPHHEGSGRSAPVEGSTADGEVAELAKGSMQQDQMPTCET